MDYEGQVAIVTGGASGLGAATVEHLAGRGAHVVLADTDIERGKELASALGARVVFAEVDVTTEDDVLAAVEAAVALGELRCVANCAGIADAQRTVSRDGRPHDLGGFRAVIDVNLVGTFNVLRLAAGAMVRNTPDDDGGRGVIVNTSSVAAFDGQVGQAAYAAAKAGIAGMTLPIARDLAPFGIRVVTIAPGPFATPMLAGLSERHRIGLADHALFPKRSGHPAEYASLVAHILDNPLLNAETIRLDAGLRMPADRSD